jgi:hypothetical protein
MAARGPAGENNRPRYSEGGAMRLQPIQPPTSRGSPPPRPGRQTPRGCCAASSRRGYARDKGRRRSRRDRGPTWYARLHRTGYRDARDAPHATPPKRLSSVRHAPRYRRPPQNYCRPHRARHATSSPNRQ